MYVFLKREKPEMANNEENNLVSKEDTFNWIFKETIEILFKF